MRALVTTVDPRSPDRSATQLLDESSPHKPYYSMVKPSFKLQMSEVYATKWHPCRKVNFFLVLPVLAFAFITLALIMTSSGAGANRILHIESLRELASKLRIKDTSEARHHKARSDIIHRSDARGFFGKIEAAFNMAIEEIRHHVIHPVKTSMRKMFGNEATVKLEKILMFVFKEIGIPLARMTNPVVAETLEFIYDAFKDTGKIREHNKRAVLEVTDKEIEDLLLDRAEEILALVDKHLEMEKWDNLHPTSVFRARYLIFGLECFLLFCVFLLLLFRFCCGPSPKFTCCYSYLKHFTVNFIEKMEFLILLTIMGLSLVAGSMEAWFASGNPTGWTSQAWSAASVFLLLTTTTAIADAYMHYRMIRSHSNKVIDLPAV